MNILTCRPEELLMALVRFQSLSTREQPLVDWLENRVRDLQLVKTERFGNNLLFTLGEGANWLFLNSHSDVVPPSANHFGNPFEPQFIDGKIYGRGSTDAKGCGTAMLRSILELANEGWVPIDGRVSFALTICEETSGEFNGMAYLRSLMDTGRLNKPDAALIGEPTLLAPCIAQKGLLVVRVSTIGESGHAARIYGKNAIYEMSRVLQQIRTIDFEDSNPFIGNVKITPTRFSSGTVNNAMPERAEIVLDIRTIPEVSNEVILNRLRAIPDCEISVISDRFVSTQTDSASDIAVCCRKISGIDYFGSPTASDWVFLADIPVVKIGPGDSAISHKHDEHIEINQVLKGIELYKGIIREYFALQNFDGGLQK
jgi:acetylornithine deacetylase